MELSDLWVSEFGTEAPAFGEVALWDFADDLKAMRWEESVIWAERINGRPLMPGQIKKLKRLHGFGKWDDKRDSVRRLVGNGKNDPHGTEAPQPGSWASVNGWNPHNRKLAGKARRLRSRVLAYCLTSFRRAVKSGGDFALKSVFAAACEAVFGRRQPYANRSRVKAFRDWVASKLDLKKVTHPPEAAPYSDAPAMFYASTEASEDFQDMTHRSQPTAGNPAEVENRQAGSDAEPVCLRGCRHDQEPASGLQLLVKAKKNETRLVGIARSALATLEDLHRGRDRIGWETPLPGDAAPQNRWAHGWLTAWVKKGRSARRLVEEYLQFLHDFDTKYSEMGYGSGECMPWALRGALQRRARELPAYGAEHFRANPAVFQPTARQLLRAEYRREERADRAAKRRAVVETVEAAPEKPEWLQQAEDEEADHNAMMAGWDNDRRRVSESDSWQRDLGNA